MNYDWNFTWVWRNFDLLLRGTVNTLALAVVTIGGGSVLGMVVALCRQSRITLLAWIAAAYIEVFRNLPVLVTMIWLFYCLPLLFGDLGTMTPFGVAVVGLGLNLSALQAEIFRAGYSAIPPGQLEAAKGLGLSGRQVLCHVVLPQAFWRSLSPALGQSVNTLKLTALASFISVNELFYVTGRLIQDTYRPLEFYTILAALYFALIFPMSFALQVLERRLLLRFSQ